MHKHLRRHQRVAIEAPVYFITVCARDRRRVLACDSAARIVIDELGCGRKRPAWAVDHLVRSTESYNQKWNYVRDNPVRAGLAAKAEDWPYTGEVEQLQFG